MTIERKELLFDTGLVVAVGIAAVAINSLIDLAQGHKMDLSGQISTFLIFVPLLLMIQRYQRIKKSKIVNDNTITNHPQTKQT